VKRRMSRNGLAQNYTSSELCSFLNLELYSSVQIHATLDSWSVIYLNGTLFRNNENYTVGVKTGTDGSQIL
jgi:hypothetical protein